MRRGWKDMAQILDREMPVERKRRRFAAWWWWSGMLLMGGTLAWYQLQSGPEQPVPPTFAPYTQEPVATVPRTETPGVTINSAKTDATYNTQQPTIGKPTAGQPAVVMPAHDQSGSQTAKNGASTKAVAPKTPAAMTANPVRAADLPQIAVPQPPVAAAANNTAPTAEIPYHPTEVIPNINPQTTAPDVVTDQALTDAALNALSLLSGRTQGDLPVALQIPTLDTTDYTPVKTVMARKSWSQPRWNGGASVGLVTRHFAEVSGAIAGLNLDWQPKKRWGVRGGIHYAYHQHLVQDVQNLALHYGIYKGRIQQHGFSADNTTTTNISTNPINYNEEVHLSIIESHRIEAPLMVFWQPTKRWRGYAGLYLGRVIHIETGDPTLPEENQRTLNDPSLIFDAAKQAANRYVNAEWPSWASGVMCGIGFRPVPNFEVNLEYQNASKWVNRSVNENFDNVVAPPSFKSARGIVPGRFQLSATWFLGSK